MENKNLFDNKDMSLLCKDEKCMVYKVINKTGEGTITVYNVFNGISLHYNDFHMETCTSRFINDDGPILEINHCREGRIEWESCNSAYFYLASGDLMIDSFNPINDICGFPLSHYHGITILISLKDITEDVERIMKQFSISLERIVKDFYIKNKSFTIRDEKFIDHIFSELYNVPENIRKEYFQIKILELLVYLKSINILEIKQNPLYFYKSQVDKVKDIMLLMTNNPDKRYTIEFLANKFDISVSALKKCFKGVYGVAIFTFMRNFRMDLATKLLCQTDLSITEIAGKVGYSNISKFSEAFKSIKGETPKNYRKLKI